MRRTQESLLGTTDVVGSRGDPGVLHKHFNNTHVPLVTATTATTSESSLPEQAVATVESRNTVPLSGCRGPESPEWSQSLRGCDMSLYGNNTYVCPPEGQAYTVWGTEIYTDDSSVCTAAVHAGLINFENGGEVFIAVRGGESYRGDHGQRGDHHELRVLGAELRFRRIESKFA